MTSEDDPEARIRELEQPLADAARASEAGATSPPGKWAAPPAPAFLPPARGPAFPPPSPPSPYGGSFGSTSSGVVSPNRIWWIVAAAFVIGMIALPAGIFFFTARHISHSGLTTLLPNPTIAPSGAAPSAGVTQAPSGAPSTPPTSGPTAAPTAPAGASLTISGINEIRTIACNGSAIGVSGISNKVVITGHCASLNVSGVKNSITVDASDAIEASGFNNQITYHSGSPTIENSGEGNTVHQG